MVFPVLVLQVFPIPALILEVEPEGAIQVVAGVVASLVLSPVVEMMARRSGVWKPALAEGLGRSLISEIPSGLAMKAAEISGAILRELPVLRGTFVFPLVWAGILMKLGFLVPSRG